MVVLQTVGILALDFHMVWKSSAFFSNTDCLDWMHNTSQEEKVLSEKVGFHLSLH